MGVAASGKVKIDLQNRWEHIVRIPSHSNGFVDAFLAPGNTGSMSVEVIWLEE